MKKQTKKIFPGLVASLVFLIVLNAYLPRLNAQDKPTIKFDHLTVQDGLSDSSALDMLQDEQGFMWIATQNGLNRYDGHEFTHYTHNPNDANSLSHNNVVTLHLDDQGILWAGTRGGGLNRFDKKTGKITRYQHKEEDPQSINGNFINAIEAAPGQKLWIGSDNGLNLFDPLIDSAIGYPQKPENMPNPDYIKVRDIAVGPDRTVYLATAAGLAWLSEGQTDLTYSSEKLGVSNLAMWDLFIDDQGFLWAGTDDGLFKLDRKQRIIDHYQHDPTDANSISQGAVMAILQDSQGQFWIGSRINGLMRFDPSTKSFTHYRHNPEDSYSLSNNFILGITEDSTGALWISNWTGGINLLSPYRFKFPPPITLQTIPLAFHEESNGTLWVGTFDQGLLRIEPESGSRTYYTYDPQDDNSLNSNTVFTLAADGKGGLWLGTLAGLQHFNPITDRFTSFSLDLVNPEGLSDISVRSLYSNTNGEVWVGTSSGLFHLDLQTEKLTAYNQSALGPGNIYIWKIVAGGPQSLWIGADNGLFRLNRVTGEFEDLNELSGTRDTTITVMYEDDQGILWLGTWGQGLIRFDPAAQTNMNYQSNAGLPGSIILGILADDQGHLWLSTNKGLTRFDPATETFRTYDREDGLADDDFAQGAYFKNAQGEMFLGIENGIVKFNPKDLAENPHTPKVYLTNFQLFNRDVSVGSDSPLKNNINYTSQIVLNHDQSVFSLEFAGLNFINPERNQYAYKMEGVDPEFNEVGNRRFVTYTNLDPGNYEFKVRAANNDGVWGEEETLVTISVQPPWWRTNTAYFFYGLAFFLLAGGIFWYRGRIQAKQLESQRRELLWERRLRENLEQMDRLKDEERGRIARELHDGLAQTLAGVRFRARTWKTIVRRNPDQILPELHDLDNILDASIRDVRRSIYALRPLSLEQLGLEAALLRTTADLAKLYQLQIDSDFKNLDALPAALEVDMFRISQELIYNAIRHGRPQCVCIRICVETDQATLQVQDDGIGFEPQQVFDNKNDNDRHFGLKQVQERVRLFKGTMVIDSDTDSGTTITIHLPLSMVNEGKTNDYTANR